MRLIDITSLLQRHLEGGGFRADLPHFRQKGGFRADLQFTGAKKRRLFHTRTIMRLLTVNSRQMPIARKKCFLSPKIMQRYPCIKQARRRARLARPC